MTTTTSDKPICEICAKFVAILSQNHIDPSIIGSIEELQSVVKDLWKDPAPTTIELLQIKTFWKNRFCNTTTKNRGATFRWYLHLIYGKTTIELLPDLMDISQPISYLKRFLESDSPSSRLGSAIADFIMWYCDMGSSSNTQPYERKSVEYALQETLALPSSLERLYVKVLPFDPVPGSFYKDYLIEVISDEKMRQRGTETSKIAAFSTIPDYPSYLF